MPLSWVDVVFDDGRGLVALEYRAGTTLARRGSGGEWVVENGAGPAVWPAGVVDGAVMGVLEDDSGASTVVSTDGVEWEPVGIEGSSDWPLGGNGQGGVLFMRDTSDPLAVWLLDRWPELERVVLPTHSPRTIQRFEDELWVLSPGALWIRGADASWEELPTGVQHGFMETPGVIPGETPTLVVQFGENIQLVRLSE
jgi:hypothetical protein